MVEKLRQHFGRSWKPRKAETDVAPKLITHGWLMPFLHKMDAILWGRWDFQTLLEHEILPPYPIPQIDWLEHSYPRKMLENCLNAIPNHGSWMGWSSSQYFDYFLQWLLHGFGHPGYSGLPKEPAGCEGASARLYQIFELGLLQLWPHDYWGDILAESNYGKRQGFYPTPLPLVQLTTEMMMGNVSDMPPARWRDRRLQRVHDPCTGTGRFALVASNYSLVISAQDIDPLLIRCALVNGYLYAPWFVRPPFGSTVRVGNSLSKEPGETVSEFVQFKNWGDSLIEPGAAHSPEDETDSAPVAIAQSSDDIFQDSDSQQPAPGIEADNEPQYRFDPIYKGRGKNKQVIGYQGNLF